MAENLFAAGPVERCRRLLEMVERHQRISPQTLRFTLAGMVTALDDDALLAAAQALTVGMREYLRTLPEDAE